MNNKRILIIEDEMLIALSLKKMLQPHFTSEDIAGSYDEAKTLMNLKKFDLALIDISLKGEKTGHDVADFINDTVKIPFIFTTALTDPETLQKILSQKPAAYLSKPVQRENLITAVGLALQNSEQHFTLEIGKQTYRFKPSQILYAESDHIYVNLHFEEGEKLLLRTTLSHLEEILPEKYFKRINRSVAVNPEQITKTVSNRIFIGENEFKSSKNF